MLEEYLDRLKLSATVPPTEEGLFELHSRQAFTIPFENVSPLIGEPVLLDIKSLHEKLVRRGRGGYCFELNGLLSWALAETGFSLVTHLARVQFRNPAPGPLAHQIMLVELGGRTWLCDVGFGGPGLRYPMPFEMDRIEVQGDSSYRLIDKTEFGYCLQMRQPDDSWLNLYFFHRTRITPPDIMMGNHFTSTWEGVIFKRWLMGVRPSADGRITLHNRQVTRKKGDLTATSEIATAKELLTVLSEEFCITLDGTAADRLAVKFDQLDRA